MIATPNTFTCCILDPSYNYQVEDFNAASMADAKENACALLLDGGFGMVLPGETGEALVVEFDADGEEVDAEYVQVQLPRRDVLEWEMSDREQVSDLCLDLDDLRGMGRPLCFYYSSECRPEPAFVQMTADGIVSAGYSRAREFGKLREVQFNCTLRWDVTPEVDGDVLVAILAGDQALTLLERVHAGHATHWERQEQVGTLDEDAQAASELFQELLDLALA